MDPVVLKTVRPFEIDNVSLAKTGIHIQDEAAVADYLSEKVIILTMSFIHSSKLTICYVLTCGTYMT